MYNHEVRSAAHVDALVNEAVKMSLSRRGVSHICFPNDLQLEDAPEKWVQKGKAGQKAMGHTSAAWTRPTAIAPKESLDFRVAREPFVEDLDRYGVPVTVNPGVNRSHSADSDEPQDAVASAEGVAQPTKSTASDDVGRGRHLR